MTLETAFVIAASLGAVGAVWECAELLVARDQVLGRMFSWPVVRSRYYIFLNRPLLGGTFDAMFAPGVLPWLLGAEMAAAVSAPFALTWSAPLAAGLALAVLAVHLVIHVRLLVGMDGADQMLTLVWVSVAVFALQPDGPLAWVAAAFLTGQLVLSYFTAGIAKASSRVWRSGEAVAQILRVSTYASPGVSKAGQVRTVSRLASWGTIAFECGAPFLVLLGAPGIVAFIVLAALFHTGIAVTMGLTTFVFSFGAALPVTYVAFQHVL
ncbi:MAG TPA: hypothetical protein VF587_12855 [Solirubrobacteraceae bacterium]